MNPINEINFTHKCQENWNYHFLIWQLPVECGYSNIVLLILFFKKINDDCKLIMYCICMITWLKGENYMDIEISILMGIYNCAGTLNEAIDSIITQTCKSWELILCDDGSSDNTYFLMRISLSLNKSLLIVA